jgi:hypothetical protein
VVATIIVSGLLSLGMVVRARWMLRSWELLVFAAGLIMLASALLGGEVQANRTESSLGGGDLFAHWPVWLALGGLVVVTIALGSWWIRQQRLSRSGCLTVDSGPPKRRWSGVRYREAGLLDWTVVALLPIGGLIPGLGWLVVMLLLWTSRVWTYREKLVATLALPGGPLIAGIPINAVKNLQWPVLAKLPLLFITVPLLFVPAAAAVFLTTRLLARSRSSAPSSSAMIGA